MANSFGKDGVTGARSWRSTIRRRGALVAVTLALGGSALGIPILTSAGTAGAAVHHSAGAHGVKPLDGNSPVITTADSTTFSEGVAGSFEIDAIGTPTPSFTETGTLPSGVTFTDEGDGQATLAGTPAVGSNGTYTLSIDAGNGIDPDAVQSFSLTVTGAPVIKTADSTTFAQGTAGSFPIVATGTPTPSFTETGALPSGVTFADEGDGQATLAGTPALGSGGVYSLNIVASNGISPNASQTFTLTVTGKPAFTSATSDTFTEGTTSTFTVTTSGYPAATITQTGALPPGVTFSAGTLSGTPTATGSYPLNFTAINTYGTAAQNFTLKVVAAPVITSTSSFVFNEDTTNTFAVTATGYPAPTFTESGTLPTGVTFTGATLSGDPTETGTFPITFTASNSAGSTTPQSFTLTVYALHVTTTSLPTLNENQSYSDTLGAAGGTAPYKWKKLGALPAGLKLSAAGVLSGTVKSSKVLPGTYDIPVEVTDSSRPKSAAETASVLLTLTIDS
jgi:hypothetical protein